MNYSARKIAMRLGLGTLKGVRFVLYVLLLVLGRALLPVANMAIIIGLVVFLFCVLIRPDLSTPMFASAGLAVSSAALSVFFEAALRAVAPANVVIVTDV